MYDFDLFMFHYDLKYIYILFNIARMVDIYILHKMTEIIFISTYIYTTN